MNIKVIVKNILFEENNTTVYQIDISEDSSIQDMLDIIGYSIADLSEYYKLSGVFSCNTICCPYIFSDNNILYNVTFDKIKLRDFIKTHAINNNTIEIVVGHVQAGGPGFKAIKEIWDAIVPYLNDIATISTISGINVKSIIDSIRAFFVKKNVAPHTVIDIILSRKQWNHKELAHSLNIPEVNTKYFLKALGYSYDSKLMQYIQIENSEELIEKISSVQVLDI